MISTARMCRMQIAVSRGKKEKSPLGGGFTNRSDGEKAVERGVRTTMLCVTKEQGHDGSMGISKRKKTGKRTTRRATRGEIESRLTQGYSGWENFAAFKRGWD